VHAWRPAGIDDGHLAGVGPSNLDLHTIAVKSRDQVSAASEAEAATGFQPKEIYSM